MPGIKISAMNQKWRENFDEDYKPNSVPTSFASWTSDDSSVIVGLNNSRIFLHMN